MPKMFVFQPSDHTDRILSDGSELYKRPYPFAALEDGTIVSAQVSIDCVKIAGFADDLARQQIDWHWSDIQDMVVDPATMVGKYVITTGKAGTHATHMGAIETVTVREF